LHTHHRKDQALYILEGEYEVQCGDQKVRAAKGSFVFAPRKIPHKLTDVSQAPSRILGFSSPAGFEVFFEEVSRLPSPPQMEKIMEIARKFELEIHAS
jgi:quercetin dioxygenase-like cupin family protein